MVFLSKIPLHTARYVHQKINPLVFPTLHINEFPKSGGTWVCRMLRDVTNWRFDDNAMPLPGPAVVKYHRKPLSVKPLALIVRDPRDVFVSLFYHSRSVFEDDPFNYKLVSIWNELLNDYEKDSDKIGAFIKRQLSNPVYPRFSWSEFYEYFLSRGTPIFRYEDFRANAAGTLSELLDVLNVKADAETIKRVSDAHSIEKILAKRTKSGEAEGSNFIRKGKVGGYADVLSSDVIADIDQAEGATMRKLGYL